MNLKKLRSWQQLKTYQKTKPVYSKTFLWIQIYLQVLTKIFNDCVKRGNFPDILKYADIRPDFKKGDTANKTNYRPISTLSNFSKVFQKMIYGQINSLIEPIHIPSMFPCKIYHPTCSSKNDWNLACYAKQRQESWGDYNGSLQSIWHAKP